MSENLNRAFIKAYDKGKSNEAKRQAAAAERESQAVSSLIMQFDTATMAVPSPHLFSARPTAETVAAPASAPMRRAVATQAARVESRPLDPSPIAHDDLRASIASQMLRAGGWEDPPIDAFIGGFPIISSPYGSNSHRESPRAAADHADRGEASPQETNAATPPRQSKTPEINSPVSANAAVEPQLVAPSAPALFREPTAAEPITPQSIRQARDAQIKHMNREGEIFRLDRPSYSQPGTAAAPGTIRDDDDSDEQSSLLDGHSGSHQHWGSGPATTASTPLQAQTLETRSASAANTRVVEENLRSARLRIFNPVWEVDSLQWPAVCLELLKQKTVDLEQVAKNLIAACEEGLQLLAVTSPQSGEGSTTVACCLALLAGSHGLNVVIVDGDIEHPSLSYQTNLDVDQDWRAAILNQIPLEEIAVHSIDDQVTLVPLLNPISQLEMSADDDRIAAMLRDLSASFDLVIVDMGRMDGQQSLITAMGEQGLINAAVAVVDHRSSTPERIESCLRSIRSAGIASIGLVENFAA